MAKQPHISVDETQFAQLVIVCGEPDRANRIANLLEHAELVSENREYRIFTGTYQGKAISVCSTGIGAPSMIIAVEELKFCGVTHIVRVGSAGAMQSHIGLGGLIVAEGAVRDEGGSAANGRRFQLGEVNCDYHIFGEMEFFTQTPCQWIVVADEHMQVDVICIQKLSEALHEIRR